MIFKHGCMLAHKKSPFKFGIYKVEEFFEKIYRTCCKISVTDIEKVSNWE